MRLRHFIPKSVRPHVDKALYQVLVKSLEAAARQQGLSDLVRSLRKIEPDITDQYSMFKVNSRYLETKVRNMHAFQVLHLEEAIKDFKKPVIVDIGDSAGTHAKYIVSLYGRNRDIDFLSVNLDAQAVEKIQKKGMRALHARAEDLQKYNINADILLCFETLEHLSDPCRFLYQLSSNTNAKYLIMTVPYLRNSRVGLHHLRSGRTDGVCAENTHIFEFSPEDWKLLIRHSGWEIAEENIYLQYPTNNFYAATKSLWKRFDFEGFYGLVLKKNNTWSSRYADW